MGSFPSFLAVQVNAARAATDPTFCHYPNLDRFPENPLSGLYLIDGPTVVAIDFSEATTPKRVSTSSPRTAP